MTDEPTSQIVDGPSNGSARSRRPRNAEFTALRKSPVVTQAIDAIKQMIVRGELLPGQSLPPERQLAGLLGISRPTLRQAISALTTMNILHARHGDGTFVTALTPEMLTQPISFLLQVDESAIFSVFEVRQVLEVAAAGLAAERITDEEIDTLRNIATTLIESFDQPQIYLETDIDLHEHIVMATHNPILIAMCSSLATVVIHSMPPGAQADDVRAVAHRHHLEIVDGICRRDTVRAQQAMRLHLSEVEPTYRAGSATAAMTGW